MSLLQFLSVPAILFMVIVAPLWLIFHYKTMWKNQKQQGPADQKAVKEMWDVAVRLEDRVANLEKLLDADAVKKDARLRAMVFEFDRTASRLIEMQTRDYLRLSRRAGEGLAVDTPPVRLAGGG